MKICRRCKKDLKLSDFHNNKRCKDGLSEWCKGCAKWNKTRYDRSKIGILTRFYDSQKQNSKNRNHPPPPYSKDEFGDWLFNNPDFNRIFENWKRSGYNKWLKPSVDRIDDYRGYTFDNIRVVTWEFNFNDSLRKRKDGTNNKTNKAVNRLSADKKFICSYHSFKQAERETGVFHQNIRRAIEMDIKAGGFYWEITT
jgi:hypothetical protein